MTVDGRHVVWDWNGTLLDDFGIVIDAVNLSISEFGEGPITATDYRDHYTRPVRAFYDSLFGRVIADEEWLRINTAFHDSYFRFATSVDLAPGADRALDMVEDAGWSQSLLSMSPQDWLDQIVSRLGLARRLRLVDGLSGPTGGLKALHLADHLHSLQLRGPDAVVIGDTPDDVAAARYVGASPILFHGGSHHMEELESLGVPVAETLVEAIEIALSPR